MTVKRIHSGGRVLLVLEEIARHQPVGVSALARLLNDDKSAVQRALSTLAEHGWIRPEPGRRQAKWELTPHIHAVARLGHDSSGLRRRARPTLKRLRDEFNETLLLTMQGAAELVLVDVVESKHMLKFVPPVGLVVDAKDSAAGQAMLSHMSSKRQLAVLGEAPGDTLLARLEQTRQNGYAVHRFEDHASIAAAVLEADGNPGAAIVLSGPLDRITPERYAHFGVRIAEAAAQLSAELQNDGHFRAAVARL